MLPLPFKLKVPGRDEVTVEHISSTSFSFRGLAQLAGSELLLEWSGTASVDEVAGLEVREETLALPTESLSIPLHLLRTVEFRGGWWLPRIELTGRDMTLLASVPGEKLGRLRLWVARRDRHLARQLVAAIRETALGLPPAPEGPDLLVRGDTPPGGATR